MRIAAVARSSTGADTIEVWIDGTKYDTSHAGTADVKMMNSFYYVPVGTHKISIFARMADGTQDSKALQSDRRELHAVSVFQYRLHRYGDHSARLNRAKNPR